MLRPPPPPPPPPAPPPPSPALLDRYMRRASARCAPPVAPRYDYHDACLMGHALEGNLHLIFNQSFKDDTEMARYEGIMQDLCETVALKYGGSLKARPRPPPPAVGPARGRCRRARHRRRRRPHSKPRRRPQPVLRPGALHRAAPCAWQAEHGTGRNVAPFVEMEWGTKRISSCGRSSGLRPEFLLNPGVILNEDPDVHAKNIGSTPSPARSSTGASRAAGVSQLPVARPLAPRRGNGPGAPRGRREPLARPPPDLRPTSARPPPDLRPASPDLPPTRSQVYKEMTKMREEWSASGERYKPRNGCRLEVVGVENTCAADSMCPEVPVKINTGELIKSLRHETLEGRGEGRPPRGASVARWLAEHWRHHGARAAAAQRGARLAPALRRLSRAPPHQALHPAPHPAPASQPHHPTPPPRPGEPRACGHRQHGDGRPRAGRVGHRQLRAPVEQVHRAARAPPASGGARRSAGAQEGGVPARASRARWGLRAATRRRAARRCTRSASR